MSCEQKCLLLQMTVAEHSFFWLSLLVASDLYGGSCTYSRDFRGVQNLFRSGNFYRLSQDVLYFIQHVDVFKVFRGFTFAICQSYVAFRYTLEIGCESDGNIMWLPYSADRGVLSDIPAGEVPGRKRSVNDETISVHDSVVEVLFLVYQLFTLADARATHSGLEFFWRGQRTGTGWWERWCWGSMGFEWLILY